MHACTASKVNTQSHTRSAIIMCMFSFYGQDRKNKRDQYIQREREREVEEKKEKKTRDTETEKKVI